MERRKFERYDLAIPVRIEVAGGSTRNYYTLWTTNISAGGAFLCTAPLIGIETDVKIEMHLSCSVPNGNRTWTKSSRIRLSGTILRVEENGVAVRFGRRYRIAAMKSALAW